MDSWNQESEDEVNDFAKSYKPQPFTGQQVENSGMEMPWMSVTKMVQQVGRNSAAGLQNIGLNRRSDAQNARNQDIATGQAGVQSISAMLRDAAQAEQEREMRRRLGLGLSTMAGF